MPSTKNCLCFTVILLFIACSGLSSHATSPSDFKELMANPAIKSKQIKTVILDMVRQSCLSGTEQEALGVIRSSLIDELHFLNIKRVNSDLALTLDYLSGSYQFLKLCRSRNIQLCDNAEFTTFLTSSHDRIIKVAEAVSADDDTQQVFSILKDLFEHEDKKDRDEFFELMLAMAIVWDQPRKAIHSQIGYSNSLKYETDIIGRYNFFKKIYDKHKAKMKYRNLGYSDLIYVVDTPVPIDELEWVIKNVRGTLSTWSNKYASIKYDTPRLNNGIYSWPGSQGAYTLESIKEYGGICVDQAYYCTMTARAYGIPALYFSGQGKTGGHAWFSYMKKTDSWVLDVGRYGSNDYTIGYARNPQTNKKMSDHEVAMVYNRAFSRSSYKLGNKYRLYAGILLQTEYLDQAYALAKHSVDLAPLNETCWDTFTQSAQKSKDNKLLLEVLDGKIKAFKKYPDLITDAQMMKAEVLKKMGRDDEAEKVLATARRRMGGGRDDLERELALKQVNGLVEQKKYKEARKCMEKVIKEQRGEQAKLLDFISIYLKMTKETDQTKDALRFVSPLIKSMYKKFHTSYRNYAVDLLATAYINNGDTKNATKIRDKYKK